MHKESAVVKVDGYVIVLDPRTGQNGRFSPRYWIYGEDRLAAKPIAWQDFAADWFDHPAAIALSEELARSKVAELKRRAASG